MRRRQFLTQAGAATLAPALAGPFVHAADKSGSKPPVIGRGEHRYVCHHGWGRVPGHVRWQETHGVALDRDGLVYITHRAGADRAASPAEAQDTVLVFEPDGTFVRSFGKEYHGGGHGIDIRAEGGREYLYLCQMMPVNLVVKATPTGEVVWTKDRSDVSGAGVYDDPKARFAPTNVAFAPDGGFYVADGYGSNLIHQYDRDARWVRTWGGTGAGPGQMRTPHGLWVDDRPGHEPSPSLVVADRANARLQSFTLDGKPAGFVGEVLFPAHFDRRGDVLLVPDLHARVSLFDRAYRTIVHLGDDPSWTEEVKKLEIRKDPSRWPAGKFVHPHDACFDRDGNVFVVEWVQPGRVTFLRRVG